MYIYRIPDVIAAEELPNPLTWGASTLRSWFVLNRNAFLDILPRATCDVLWEGMDVLYIFHIYHHWKMGMAQRCPKNRNKVWNNQSVLFDTLVSQCIYTALNPSWKDKGIFYPLPSVPSIMELPSSSQQELASHIPAQLQTKLAEGTGRGQQTSGHQDRIVKDERRTAKHEPVRQRLREEWEVRFCIQMSSTLLTWVV